MKNSSDVREGIWILAVLCFVVSLGLVAGGIQLFSLADIFRGVGGLPLADPTTGAAMGTVSAGVFCGIGLLLIGLGIFSFFVGRGLLKAQKWSKIAEGVVSAIIAIMGILLMFNSFILIGIVALAISGLKIWYLFVKKSTKKYFKN